MRILPLVLFVFYQLVVSHSIAIYAIYRLKNVDKNQPLISYKEFVDAVTSCNYPAPSFTDYKHLVSQSRHLGRINNKRELAMFLAHVLWESDGLRARKEYACVYTDCPTEYKSDNDLPGKHYYGRGYIQLTWSDNYRATSRDIFGDDRLFENPELVSSDKKISWATAFSYWKRNVHPIAGVRRGEFGASTRIVNGILECQGENKQAAKYRYQNYSKILRAFGVNQKPIEKGCYN